MSKEHKHTAVMMQKNNHWRWFRESDNEPLSPIFTNIQAAVTYPNKMPLLTDAEWSKGENVLEDQEPLIVGPNG